MAQQLKAAPFALDVLVQSGPVLALRDGAWYVAWVFPMLDEPVAALSWYKVRRCVNAQGRHLELRDELDGRRADYVGGHFRVKLPESYQKLGDFLGFLETENQAAFTEKVPIPKPPGRLPVEWKDGRWQRNTARGLQRYVPSGWVKVL